MKQLSILLLAFALVFGVASQAEARDHRPSSKHGYSSKHGPKRGHKDFGPGYSRHGHQGHYRHHSKPTHHKRYGSYYRKPGYYGKHYYGKKIFLPGLGFIYIR